MEAFKGFLQLCQEFLVALWQTALLWFTDPLIASGIAVVLLVLLLVFFLSKKQPSRIRAFNNGSGYVEISRSALVDIIRSKSEQIDIEKKPGVVIRTRRGKLHVDIKIRLLPSRRLTEVSDILQQHLREALQDGLGIRKLGNINVMVTGVRVKTGKAARKSLPLNPEPPKSRESDTQSSAEAESATFEVMDDDASKKSDDSDKHTEKREAEPAESAGSETDKREESSEVSETKSENVELSQEDSDKREKGSV